MAKLALMMEEKQKKRSSELVLEINLVSAQGLKVDDDLSNTLRTRMDCLGDENPTWNDKFLFRLSSEFVNSATAAFNVEIYTVRRHFLKDSLVGTARCLLSNLLGKMITPVYIHGPSGNFHGILNVSASHFMMRKSLLVWIRLVRSSPSLSTLLSAQTTPLNESKEEVAKMRKVKSDSSMLSLKSDHWPTMLRTLSSFSTLPDDEL
ncbi:OLC1v1005677C1 [Oldenlandia corymbosa var. corymbosa]|uniref:OLC1v1005677C1 n=1 Tax=Oldenlandia corymbosa var. corymbosa TaxID=529605 RepID=A0AAV1DI35_OLDCO|nr:OLC1v1005677C1 [Oldenlandia corymbosa var. corymbosa]